MRREEVRCPEWLRWLVAGVFLLCVRVLVWKTALGRDEVACAIAWPASMPPHEIIHYLVYRLGGLSGREVHLSWWPPRVWERPRIAAWWVVVCLVAPLGLAVLVLAIFSVLRIGSGGIWLMGYLALCGEDLYGFGHMLLKRPRWARDGGDVLELFWPEGLSE